MHFLYTVIPVESYIDKKQLYGILVVMHCTVVPWYNPAYLLQMLLGRLAIFTVL